MSELNISRKMSQETEINKFDNDTPFFDGSKKTFSDSNNNKFSATQIISNVLSKNDFPTEKLLIQHLSFNSTGGKESYRYNRVSIRLKGQSTDEVVKIMRSNEESCLLVEALERELASYKYHGRMKS